MYGIINNYVQMSRKYASNIFKLIYFYLEQIYIIVYFLYLSILIGFTKSQNSKNVCYYLFLLAELKTSVKP